MIKITDDKKEKPQSWEASEDKDGGEFNGYYSFSLNGYGENERECRLNLNKEVDNMIICLEEIKKENNSSLLEMNKDNIQVIEADNGDRAPVSVTTRADEAAISNENGNVFKEVTIKFSPWKEVWIMDDNKAKKLIVFCAVIKNKDLGDKGVLYDLATQELIDRIKKDYTLTDLCMVRRQNEIFASKEELLKSL